MKIFNKILIIIIAVACLGGLTVLVKAAASAIDLATAEDFAVLAGSAITDSNPDAGIDIVGDVGLSPTGGASITGLTCTQVTGTIYDTDAGYAGGGGCLITDAGLLTTAKDDLALAYIDANSQTPDILIGDGDIGGGETLTPGVYSEDSTPDSLAISGALILDGGGDPNAVFVFQTDTTLITGAGSEIILTNGTQACNVFWQVGTSATLGTNSTFVGTIMALASITDNGGSTVEGRLLADADDNTAGAVTLNDTTVTVPACAPSATLTITKVVMNDDSGTSVVGDFTLLLDGVAITSGVATTTSIGSFTVTETGPAGYDGTFGGDCDADGDITMTDGNTYTCTLTNDDEEVEAEEDDSGGSSSGSRRRQDSSATLRVIKRVVNVGGGTATSSDFTVFVREDGENVSGSPASGRAAPGRSYTLSPGTYIVSETANPSYAQSFSGDCNANGVVTLSEDDDETCTITNTYASVIPTLPNTGFPQQERNVLWSSLALACAALAVFGIVSGLRRGFNH